jgi:hypothetical protein
MKAKAIILNWVLSPIGLSIDTEHSPIWAVLLMFAWFGASSLLLIRADRKGWLRDICKRFKIDEL